MALLRFPLPPQLLRISDVAKILRCSRKTVRSYIESGDIPAAVLKLGRSTVYRIKQADLTAWIGGKIFRPQTALPTPKTIRVPQGPFSSKRV